MNVKNCKGEFEKCVSLLIWCGQESTIFAGGGARATFVHWFILNVESIHDAGELGGVSAGDSVV